MGRRTVLLLGFIRFLRTTDPKYSFEVFIFHIMLVIAVITFYLLDEIRLWLYSSVVLWLSLSIQYWRIRRVAKRQLAQTKLMLALLEWVALAYEQQCAQNREPPDPTELALLREAVKQAHEREAAGKCQ